MTTATANQVMGNRDTCIWIPYYTHSIGIYQKRPLESFKTQNYSRTYKFDIIL